ncbi:MAG: hypothetical protein HZB95_00495 [Nitrosomonadales bacterium]|nr:hypothetical protein [Nitrosomonadales bacterium]
MIKFEEAMRVWGSPQFGAVLKHGIEGLNPDLLPLQQGLSASSSVADEPFTVMIDSITDNGDIVRVRAGILYQGETGGCSCADDPGTADRAAEYCQVQLDIDKATAVAEIRLLP